MCRDAAELARSVDVMISSLPSAAALMDGAQRIAQAGATGLVIAETEKEIRTMTVSQAVLDLDLTESQTIVFRNAAHDGLSVVYRRPDGNIGWIDPERTLVTREGATGEVPV